MIIRQVRMWVCVCGVGVLALGAAGCGGKAPSAGHAGATETYQREKSLFEQKVGAENDMIEAQMRFEEYETARKASEQRLHVLGLSEREIAALSPANHGSLSGALDVRAPMNGTLIEKHAVVGELVEPGKDVMVLADLDPGHPHRRCQMRARCAAWLSVWRRNVSLPCSPVPTAAARIERELTI